ncbi:DUF6284 family protein [Streptomyces sp. NPDC088810]|uniref:DUF6284 family protein n=1 Tax=Streptomyces sp. NPDC088810 TaxID=3365904 RepID=UPI0037F55FE2
MVLPEPGSPAIRTQNGGRVTDTRRPPTLCATCDRDRRGHERRLRRARRRVLAERTALANRTATASLPGGAA